MLRASLITSLDPHNRKRPQHCWRLTLCRRVVPPLVLGGTLMLMVGRVDADEVSPSDPMFRRLAAELTVVVQGKSLRDALQQVADRASVNLWIDRRVDVSQTVASTDWAAAESQSPRSQGERTVFDALARVASQANCVVFPVHDVVLVGRPTWVDQTAAALLRAQQHYAGPQEAGQTGAGQVHATSSSYDPAGSPPPISSADLPILVKLSQLSRVVNLSMPAGTVSWDRLSTPSEALRRTLGGSIGEPAGADFAPAASDAMILPHDLWPAVRWTGLPRYAAATLVLAQFDHRRDDAGGPSKPVRRRYASGRAGTAAREVLQRTDPDAQIRTRGDWMVARARPNAHRAATEAFIRELASMGNSGRDRGAPPPRFDLRLINKPADQVLKQLAGAARKTCHIDPQAAPRCRALVSLEAENATLEELAQQVGQQIDVVVDWNADGGVRVRLAEP